MNFNVLQLNIQSINNKVDLLEKLLLTYNIDCALIQETWTKPQQTIKLKSYNIIIKSRENSRGGGVAIIVKDTYPYFTKQTIEYEKIEHIEIKIKVFGIELNLISFYNPNQNNTIKTIQNFTDILENNKNEKLSIIGGDINAFSGLWNEEGIEDNLGSNIADIITASPFLVINNGKNTRINSYNNTESAIDLTIVSQELISKCKWDVIEDTIGSDHKPILIKLDIVPTKVKQKQIINKHQILNEINNLRNMNFNQITELTNKMDLIIKSNTKIINIDPRKQPKKWWNETIERLWKIKREKLKIYNRIKDLHTSIELKKATNKLKLEIKKAKIASWNDFLKDISSSNQTQLWKLIKSIKLSNSKNPILTDDLIATNFLQYNFPQSMENFSPPSINSKEIRTFTEFTYQEFEEIIKKSKNTAPGIDKISFELIKNMSNEMKEGFLKLLNLEWGKGIYPDSWKTIKIIGIPKPNTDTSNFKNLRPISLLPVPAKILDKMILNKMKNHADEYQLIPENSFGFKKGKSINDLFVNMLESIERNKHSKLKNLIIKLDIKKAFDTVNKNILIEILSEMKYPIAYTDWIYGHLTNRVVKINNNQHTTNAGLPQGSPFSPFLFVLYTTKIHNLINSNSKIFQYADDVIILVNGKSNESLKANTNLILERLTATLNDLKLELSAEKCQYMRINPNFDPNFIISLRNNQIQEVNQSKILGITMTNRVSLAPHYKNIKQNAYKAQNMLKIISNRMGGAHPKNSLNTYKATTKAQINFAMVITDENKKNLNKMVQTVKNNSLRISTGVPKTCPINALLAETGELPTDLDNIITTMNYMAKQIHTCTPLGNRILNQNSLKKFNNLMENNNFMFCIAPIQNKPNILPNNMEIHSDLGALKKNVNNIQQIKTAFNEMINNYSNWKKIYTDASKSEIGQGIGIYIENEQNQKESEISIKVAGNLSIKSLEAIAIKEAIIMATTKKWQNCLIITDSKSTCTALQQNTINPSHFFENCIINLAINQNQKFHIQWVPGHSAIWGNEIADNLAKIAVNNPNIEEINQIIPFKEVKRLIKETVFQKWTIRYNNSSKGIFNKLINNNKPPKTPWIQNTPFNSKESRIILRMRVGHTYDGKYKALLKLETSSECQTCNQIENFEHLISYCKKYDNIRQKYKALKKPIAEILKSMKIQEIKEIIQFYNEAKLEF